MSVEGMGDRFCRIVAAREDMTNATARIGAWLVGVALIYGKQEVEVTLRQIREGFDIDGGHIAGTGSRNETINVALNWLEANKLLTSREGRATGFGYHSRHYSLAI